MRRILLSCASAAVLLLPAAAGARVSAHAKSKPGYLVVRKAAGNGGVHGHPVVTLVVKGFVLGRVSSNKQARIDIYHLPRAGHAPHVVGDVTPIAVTWRGRVPGMEYTGTGFRFRAIGGFYRVVVRGAGVYLFAGGHGTVKLRGSSFERSGDGTYSIDGATPRSLPARTLKRDLGRG
ncbi:MAG TPA: hypothetical protein VJ716_10560 [Gaiellaceae bacterium]|nr:hypothetical protein [Gaiellaceae bacterium]